MKWLLIYIIMTAEFGTSTIVHEVEGPEFCEYLLTVLDMTVKNDGDFKAVTISACLPTGTGR